MTLPRRKTTPSSYCLTTLTDIARSTTRRTAIATRTMMAVVDMVARSGPGGAVVESRGLVPDGPGPAHPRCGPVYARACRRRSATGGGEPERAPGQAAGRASPGPWRCRAARRRRGSRARRARPASPGRRRSAGGCRAGSGRAAAPSAPIARVSDVGDVLRRRRSRRAPGGVPSGSSSQLMFSTTPTTRWRVCSGDRAGPLGDLGGGGLRGGDDEDLGARDQLGHRDGDVAGARAAGRAAARRGRPRTRRRGTAAARGAASARARRPAGCRARTCRSR